LWPAGAVVATKDQASGAEGPQDEEGMGPFGGGGAQYTASLGLSTPEPVHIDDRGRADLSGYRGKSNGIAHEWAQARADELHAQSMAASAIAWAGLDTAGAKAIEHEITTDIATLSKEQIESKRQQAEKYRASAEQKKAEAEQWEKEAKDAGIRRETAADRIDRSGDKDKTWAQAHTDAARLAHRYERAREREEAAAQRAAQRLERKGRAWRRARRHQLYERERRHDRRQKGRLQGRLPADSMERWSAAQDKIETLQDRLEEIENTLDDPRTSPGDRSQLEEERKKIEAQIEAERIDQYWEENGGFPCAELDCCDAKYAKCRPPCPPSRPICKCFRPADCPDETKPKEKKEDPKKPTTPGSSAQAAKDAAPEGIDAGVGHVGDDGGQPRRGGFPGRVESPDDGRAPDSSMSPDGDEWVEDDDIQEGDGTPEGTRTVGGPSTSGRDEGPTDSSVKRDVATVKPIPGTNNVRVLPGDQAVFRIAWDGAENAPPSEMLVYDSVHDVFYILAAEGAEGDKDGTNQKLIEKIWSETRAAHESDETATVATQLAGASLTPMGSFEEAVHFVADKVTSFLGFEGDSLAKAKFVAGLLVDKDGVDFIKSVARGEPDLRLAAALAFTAALGAVEAKAFSKGLGLVKKEVTRAIGNAGKRKVAEDLKNAVLAGLGKQNIRPSAKVMKEIRQRIDENIDDLIGASSTYSHLQTVSYNTKQKILGDTITKAAEKSGKRVVVNLQGILERQHAVRREFIRLAGFTQSKTQRGYMAIVVTGAQHKQLTKLEEDALRFLPIRNWREVGVKQAKEDLKAAARFVYGKAKMRNTLKQVEEFIDKLVVE